MQNIKDERAKTLDSIAQAATIDERAAIRQRELAQLDIAKWTRRIEQATHPEWLCKARIAALRGEPAEPF